MTKMDEYGTKYVEMDIEFWECIEDEICRLIMQTHWRKFVLNMNELFIQT